jgi:peptide/nickel transport system ATP-binding protein
MMQSGGKNTVLEIKNLSVSFHSGPESVTAVNQLSLSIGQGESIGLVGESGSGKSVTALSIMRLLDNAPSHAATGVIEFTDSKGQTTDLRSLPEKEMRLLRGSRIGMVFQEPMTSLNPVFRCGHQILEAVRRHHPELSETASKARVMELLEQVKLPDPERAYSAWPHQLSGGQKQRIMIAMAISCNPDLLIADEPTTALDVTVQQDILHLLRHLQRTRGMSLLFISHDLGVISKVADRVAVMYRGRLVEVQPTPNLFATPSHPYTRGLLACRPPLPRVLSRLPVVEDFLSTQNPSQSVENRLAELSLPKEVVLNRRDRIYKTPPIIQVDRLNTWFATKSNFWGRPTAYLKAVHNVSFDIHRGEMLGLVGESGCGKTTLGRTLVRLRDPLSGTILFDGHDLTAMPADQLRPLRRRFQIVFQDPFASLNPRMPIGKAILEPMEVHGIPSTPTLRKARVSELLEAVGLHPDHIHRYPHEFSGGQRQRICIARALALSPEFILFDESVSALDVSVQAQVLNLLLDLRDRYNFSCLFISHDLSVVKFLCDRIMVMKDGAILESGWPEDIYEHPTHEYTRQLIAAIPVI